MIDLFLLLKHERRGTIKSSDCPTCPLCSEAVVNVGCLRGAVTRNICSSERKTLPELEIKHGGRLMTFIRAAVAPRCDLEHSTGHK